MEYEVSDIKRDIRAILDENMNSSAITSLGESGTLSVDDLIESKLEDGARSVELEAPLYLLDTGKSFGDSIAWESHEGIGRGVITLPDDFMRLVSFQMSDWRRSVTSVIYETDALYQAQQSRYAGVRGCPQKPVVAIVQTPVGLSLEFYSCSGGAGVGIKKARYLPYPKIEAGKIQICEKLKRSVEYYTAALVAMTLGDMELSENLNKISKSLQV